MRSHIPPQAVFLVSAHSFEPHQYFSILWQCWSPKPGRWVSLKPSLPHCTQRYPGLVASAAQLSNVGSLNFCARPFSDISLHTTLLLYLCSALGLGVRPAPETIRAYRPVFIALSPVPLAQGYPPICRKQRFV